MLDAGCGWGLAGVYCARRGARVVGFDIDPEVLPIAQFHAQFNHVTISTQTRGFDAVDADMLNEVSWVVGADICFRGDLIDPLFGLAERACAAGVRMAIADPGRPPFKRWPAAASTTSTPVPGPSAHPSPSSPGPGSGPSCTVAC